MSPAEKRKDYSALFQDDLALFRDSFLLERLTGIRELSEEKVARRMDVLGLNLPGPQYCTVIFAPYLMEKEAEEIDHILMEIVHQVQDAYVSRQFDCYTVSDSYCNAIAVLSLPSSKSYLQADEITRELTSAIARQHKVRIFVGIGDRVDRFADINRSANSASLALSFKYTFAQDSVIRAGDVERFYSRGAQSYRQHYDKILGCFYDGNLRQMSERLQDLLEVIKCSSKNELDSMRNVCIELSAAMLRQANEIGVEYPSDGIYMRIALTPTVPELINDLLALSRDLLARISDEKRSKNMQLVHMAEDYIEAHLYDQELTLRAICEYVDLSQPYFSSIFYKETGLHLSEYINTRRIEQAKLLLTTTNSKIVRISQQLGFSHPSYFNNLFKKYTGMTPQKYRENEH